MKLALITPYDYPSPGGVAEHISALDREFRVRGHDTRIIAASTRSQAALPANVIRVTGEVSPIPFHDSAARITLAPAIFPRIQDILDREDFDVIHVHEPTAPLLSWTALLHAAPHALKIGTFHAYRETNRLFKYGHAWANYIVERLDGRIFVSEAVRDHVTGSPTGDHAVIPNGIDVARFSSPAVAPIIEYAGGPPNILFAGHAEPRNGLEPLLRALPAIQDAVPGTRLLIVGAYTNAERAPLVEEALRNGMTDVHWIGPVAPEELPRYYRTATLLCAPSTDFESSGTILLQAMAAGVPIVASDMAGHRQVLTDRIEGRLVPLGDAAALANATISLLQDPAVRRRMAARGLKTAAAYDWRVIAERVLEYYHRLFEARAARPALTRPVYTPVAQCSPA